MFDVWQSIGIAGKARYDGISRIVALDCRRLREVAGGFCMWSAMLKTAGRMCKNRADSPLMISQFSYPSPVKVLPSWALGLASVVVLLVGMYSDECLDLWLRGPL